MSKARNIADLGSNDVLDTDGTGATVSGHLTVSDSTPDFVIQDTDGTNQLMKMQQVGGASMIKFRSDTNDGELYFTGEVTGNNKMKIATNGDITMYKDDGSTTGLFFDASSGDVGIGTASVTEKLTIRGDTSADTSILLQTYNSTPATYNAAKLQFELTSSASSTRDWDIVADDPSNNGGYLGVEYEGGELFRITSGGVVDIKKQINEATLPNTPSNHALTFYPPVTAGYFGGGISWSEGTNTAASINAVDAGSAGALHLAFSTGSNTAINEVMRITSDGSLMVNKTTTGASTDGFEAHYNNYIISTSDGGPAAYFNRRTSDGTILEFRKDNTTVGSIGTGSNRLYVGTSNVGLYFASAEVLPWNTSTNATRDNAIDLGNASGRWKDLYLSGGVYLGGTGSANKLDNYEEGTFNLALSTGSTTNGYVLSSQNCKYTKIGNVCYVTGEFNFSTVPASYDGSVGFTGLPFTSGFSNAHQIGVAREVSTSGDIFVTQISQGLAEMGMNAMDGITNTDNQGILSGKTYSFSNTYITT